MNKPDSRACRKGAMSEPQLAMGTCNDEADASRQDTQCSNRAQMRRCDEVRGTPSAASDAQQAVP